MLTLMTLLACTSGRAPVNDSADTTPTDTFPSFYGTAPKNLLVI
jgi:hypothetical protein